MLLKLYQYKSTLKRVTTMWRDQVLRSPKLYLGREWNADGLHELVLEIIRLAADPHTANDSTTVATTLRHDGSLLVADDGRGLPVQILRPWDDATLSGPALELVLTVIFERHPDHHYHEQYGFLNYLGLVLNTVAARLEIDTCTDRQWYRVVCAQGAMLQPLDLIEAPRPFGTRIGFWPDPLVFGTDRFDAQRLQEGIRQLAQTYPQVNFLLCDENEARIAS
jgi:DNA gyrase/topoisomerase IV subunit B